MSSYSSLRVSSIKYKRYRPIRGTNLENFYVLIDHTNPDVRGIK
jgi:hypothetical protein